MPDPTPLTGHRPVPVGPSAGSADRTAFSAAAVALIVAASALVAWLGSHADVYTIDSYYYLAKAKSLAAGKLFEVPWNDGIDRKFFWGYSLALALPVWAFGDHGFWLLAAALYAWAGLVGARILRRLPLSTDSVRLGALALMLFNPVALWWSTVPMAEPLLVALALTAVLFALRYRADGRSSDLLWAALFAGLSLFTRAEGVFVFLALAALVSPRLWRERRFGLAALGVALFVAPEALHVLYLAAHALPSRGTLAYLDEVRRHLRDLNLLGTFLVHLRAPYWMIFRFDTEPWLYARFFPGWLTVAQGVVLALYLAALAAVLARGLITRRGSPALAAALAVVAFALLHMLWYYAYERYDYLVAPAAALVFACGFDLAASALAPRRRNNRPSAARGAIVLAACFACAAISGLYGARVSQMHAARLALHQRGRDYRAIAAAANAQNPRARPVVTDLGPYLAYYLTGHSFFDRSDADFYDDVVPSGPQGREFLTRNQVAEVISTRSERDLQAELGLAQPEDYRRVAISNVTLLVLAAPGAAPPGPPEPGGAP